MQPVALTIAGSDPSGGAGIQADLKTFHQFGVYGEAVITLITVQNTVRVDRVKTIDPELVIQQLRAVQSLELSAAPAARDHLKLLAAGDTGVVENLARFIGSRTNFFCFLNGALYGGRFKYGSQLSSVAENRLRQVVIAASVRLTSPMPTATH